MEPKLTPMAPESIQVQQRAPDFRDGGTVPPHEGVTRLVNEVGVLHRRLEIERRRLGVMHDFINRAIHVPTLKDLKEQACDSIRQLLDCRAGVFWCLRSGCGVNCLHQSGAGDMPESTWRTLEGWIADNLLKGGHGGQVWLPPELGFGAESLAELVTDGEGRPLCVVIACELGKREAASQDAPCSAGISFSLFAKKVGILLEHFRQRAEIKASDERIALGLVPDEQESHARRDFLAAVSHEIRTPLNGIMAAFQMLKADRDSSRSEHILNLGEISGKWLLDILEKSLDLTRLGSGESPLATDVVEIRPLLEEFNPLIPKTASENQPEPSWRVAPEVPQWVRLDSARFRRVMTHLLHALPSTRRSCITLELEAGKKSNENQMVLRFLFELSGVDLASEASRTLSQPAGEAVAESGAPGNVVGLGLLITHELIRLMKGSIQVENKIGQGSVLVFSLPVECGTNTSLPEVNLSDPAMQKFAGTILLVEDDPISAELGMMMIEQLGLEVDVAGDGEEALRKISAKPYDLILMDCWMPVKNGIQATRDLRAMDLPRARSVPIIALTANSKDSDATECREAGMNAFMTKPLLFEDLIAQLRKFLPSPTIEGTL